jgi:hypothetical protein
VAALDNSANLTYHFGDAQGSIIALANASGQVTEKYAYTAYGQAVVTGAGTAAYRYAGRRFDAETGLYFPKVRYRIQKLFFERLQSAYKILDGA